MSSCSTLPHVCRCWKALVVVQSWAVSLDDLWTPQGTKRAGGALLQLALPASHTDDATFPSPMAHPIGPLTQPGARGHWSPPGSWGNGTSCLLPGMERPGGPQAIVPMTHMHPLLPAPTVRGKWSLLPARASQSVSATADRDLESPYAWRSGPLHAWLLENGFLPSWWPA